MCGKHESFNEFEGDRETTEVRRPEVGSDSRIVGNYYHYMIISRGERGGDSDFRNEFA